MNIIITGASKGIGAELVRIFSRNKNNQIFAISRNRENMRKLYSECLKINADCKVVTFEFDLEQFEFYPFLVQKIESAFRHVDILIHNAGQIINKPFSKTTAQDFDKLFNINVKSIFLLTQMLLPDMNAGGHIVTIGSMSGIGGKKKHPGLSLYSTTKGAIATLTEALAEELQDRNIFVNGIALGSVQTEMFEKAFPGKKASLNPAQAAQYIADFALNGQKYFNGKILPVSASLP
ncbi:MAG: SDR family oxidoreductase [Bacteroidota bacterium]|nr:SDR family oxidoreductase [Bacteroidota bacterium]